MQKIKDLISADGKDILEDLPDGVHSGLVRKDAKGIFFYFRADIPNDQPQHYW